MEVLTLATNHAVDIVFDLLLTRRVSIWLLIKSSSGSMSTTVVVDDRDSSLLYGGIWLQSQGRGTEYFGTTSLGNSSGASLTFPFQGNSVQIWATHGYGDPVTATFSMDGSPIIIGTYNTTIIATPTFHNIIFNSSTLPSGNHTVVMTVTPLGTAPNLFVDMITYTYDPANGPPTIGDIFLDDEDIALKFSSSSPELLPNGPAYNSFLNTTHYMPKDSTMQYTFNGSGVKVYGTLPMTTTTGDMATFQIDKLPATTVAIPRSHLDFVGGLAGNNLYFTGSNLNTDVHTLKITSKVNNLLFVDYLTVPASGYSPIINGTNGSSVTAGGSTSSPPTDASAIASSVSLNNTGLVAGGVIGGLAVIILILFLAIYWWRKARGNGSGSQDPSMTFYYSQRAVPSAVTPFVSGTAQQVNQYNNSHSGSLGMVTDPYFNNNHARSEYTPNSSLSDSYAFQSPLNNSTSPTSPPLSVGGWSREREGGLIKQNIQYAPESQLVSHSDSGLRLPRTNVRRVEVPPGYTQN